MTVAAKLTQTTLYCKWIVHLTALHDGLGQRSRTTACQHRSLLIDVNTAGYHGYHACRVPWPSTLCIVHSAYSAIITYQLLWHETVIKKVKKRIAVCATSTAPLRELASHMGSHSVTCHPAKVTFPPLPQPIKAGTRFSDARRMQGWVDRAGLVYRSEEGHPSQY